MSDGGHPSVQMYRITDILVYVRVTRVRHGAGASQRWGRRGGGSRFAWWYGGQTAIEAETLSGGAID